MKKIIMFSMALLAAGSFVSCRHAEAPAEESPLATDLTLQLYSIREVIGDSTLYADNHEQILAQLAEMGYKNVETANFINGKFYGVSPEQFKTDCEAAGLQPLSSHTTRRLTDEEIANHDFEAALQWWDEAIAAHKAAGMTYIVTPWQPNPASIEEAQTFCDYHNAIGEKCNAAGLKYGYHTHSQEYQTIPGTDKVWIEYMMENIDPANMFWQLDTYLAVKGGVSPVAYIKKYPGRFALLHLKDMYELGQSGMVYLEPIIKAAADSGLEYCVVEQEGTDGSHSIMEGMAMNADYLRSHGFAK